MTREGLDKAFMKLGGKTFVGSMIDGSLGSLPDIVANLVAVLFDESRNPMARARLIRLAAAPAATEPIFKGDARELVLTVADLPAGFRLVETDGDRSNFQHTFAKGVMFGHSPAVVSAVTIEPLPAVASHSFQLALQAHEITVRVDNRRDVALTLGKESRAEVGRVDGKTYFWAVVRQSNVLHRTTTHGVELATALDLVSTQVARWRGAA